MQNIKHKVKSVKCKMQNMKRNFIVIISECAVLIYDF